MHATDGLGIDPTRTGYSWCSGAWFDERRDIIVKLAGRGNTSNVLQGRFKSYQSHLYWRRGRERRRSVTFLWSKF